jgi:hypothetical protein
MQARPLRETDLPNSASESGDGVDASGMRPGDLAFENEIETLRRVVANAAAAIDVADLQAKRVQLAAVERTIADLGRHAVPVPTQLTSLHKELRTATGSADTGKEALLRLRNSLSDLIKQVDMVLPPTSGRARPRREAAAGGHSRKPTAVPRGFTVDGVSHPVASWIDVLRELSRVLSVQHPDDFEQVLSLRGRVRPPFSRDPSVLVAPHEVPDTGIYLDANKSAAQISTLAYRLAEMFGLRNSDFSIDTQ